MFRAALKSVSKSGLSSTRCISSSSKLIRSSTLNTSFKANIIKPTTRSYSTQNEGDELLARLTQKISNNPSVLEGIQNLQILLKDKGIEPENGSLSPWQYIAILKDSDIRESFKNLGLEFQKADIKLSPNEIEKLLLMFKLDK